MHLLHASILVYVVYNGNFGFWVGVIVLDQLHASMLVYVVQCDFIVLYLKKKKLKIKNLYSEYQVEHFPCHKSAE
jgi:hypothetical protein